MKSKKKLLLMGVGVMGALAVGVGATSTFAWFQVSNTGAAMTKSFNQDNITSVKPTGTVAVDLPLAVTFTAGTDASLELAHYYTASQMNNNARHGGGTWTTTAGKTYGVSESTQTTATDTLYTAYHLNNAGHTLVYSNAAIGSASGKVLNTVVTINIKAPANTLETNTIAYIDPDTGVKYTQEDIADLLQDKYVDLKVEQGADRYVSTQDTVAVAGVTYYSDDKGTPVSPAPTVGSTNVSAYYELARSRAKFYYLGSSSSPSLRDGKTSIDTSNSSDTAAYGYVAEHGHQLNDLDGSGINLYLGMYIEGDNSGTVDVRNYIITGDFKVTVKAGR